jgi:hypothetical protein
MPSAGAPRRQHRERDALVRAPEIVDAYVAQHPEPVESLPPDPIADR